MSIRDVLAREMGKGNGTVRLVKVPRSKRPTAESLRELEDEISSHISANEAMRCRSMNNALRQSGK